MKIKGELSELDTLSNTGYIYYLVLEMIHHAIAPLPGLNRVVFKTSYDDFDDTVESSINEYLLLFSVTRIFELFRVLLLYSSYMN